MKSEAAPMPSPAVKEVMGNTRGSPAKKGGGGPTAIYNVNLQGDPPVCQEFSEGKVQRTAPLEHGTRGQLIAKFPGLEWQSALPNLTLENVVKANGPRMVRARMGWCL